MGWIGILSGRGRLRRKYSTADSIWDSRGRKAILAWVGDSVPTSESPSGSIRTQGINCSWGQAPRIVHREVLSCQT